MSFSKLLTLFAALAFSAGMVSAQDIEKEITVTIDEDSDQVMKIIIIEDGETKEIELEGNELIWTDEKSNYLTKKVLCKPAHGFLGVQLKDLNCQLSEYFGVDRGVLIEEIIKDSAAEEAGLKAGDVIIKIEDTKIGCGSDVIAFMQGTKPEEKVKVCVKRKGKNKSKKVTLGAAPAPKHKKIIKKEFMMDHDMDHMEDIHMMFKGKGGPNVFQHGGKDKAKIQQMVLKKELEIIKAQIKELRKEIKDLRK
ncbi:MAG: PDZ domain-containing protein [bacterium]|nr:PDZ domain-containing protein [bacterium]